MRDEIKCVMYGCRYCKHGFGDPELVRSFVEWTLVVWKHMEKIHNVFEQRESFLNDHLVPDYVGRMI